MYKEGALDAGVIEKDKLIDNHYYAIANKVPRAPVTRARGARDEPRHWPRPQASLSKPKDLNPPQKGQDEFQKKFGTSWTQALADGKCYNAVDGCKRLGIDGAQMDKNWVRRRTCACRAARPRSRPRRTRAGGRQEGGQPRQIRRRLLRRQAARAAAEREQLVGEHDGARALRALFVLRGPLIRQAESPLARWRKRRV